MACFPAFYYNNCVGCFCLPLYSLTVIDILVIKAKRLYLDLFMILCIFYSRQTSFSIRKQKLLCFRFHHYQISTFGGILQQKLFLFFILFYYLGILIFNLEYMRWVFSISMIYSITLLNVMMNMIGSRLYLWHSTVHILFVKT